MSFQKIGKYQIIKELGAGGMGTVYEAVHEDLGRTVALKVIKDSFAGKDSHLNRFKREADVCSKLKHKNIIQLFDYGEENGILFYAMELIDADTLDEYSEKLGGHVPIAKVLKIGLQLCSALAYLHERGLIHRDLKPANVMVNNKGHITLMDFGLVKALEKTQLTQEGKAIGTPRYMSPEMLRASGVTSSSDIFQLGIILYELATGAVPFTGSDIYVLARNILSSDPKPPGQIIKGISPYFDALITNCLEKETSLRYKNAKEVAEDIKRIRKGFPVLLRREAELSTLAGDTDSDESTGQDQSRPGKETEVYSESGKHRLLNLSSSRQSGTVAMSSSSIPGSGYISSLIDFDALFKETFKGRFPILVGTFILLAVVSLSFLSFKEDEPYRSSEVASSSDIESVIVNWQGNRPYTSKVRVWKDTQAPDHGHIYKSTQSPQDPQSHMVLVKQLNPNARYLYRIEFPDGTHSLPYKLAKMVSGELEITKTQVYWKAIDKLKVTWTSNVKAKSAVTFIRNGKEETFKLAKNPDILHQLNISNITYNEEIENIRLTLKSASVEKTLRVNNIGGPSSAICDLLVAITSFASEENINGIAAEIDHLARNKSPESARKYFMEKLDENHINELLESNKPLFEPIFKSPETSMRSIKIPLYSHLRRLGQLDSLLEIHGSTPIFNVDSLYQPLFTLSHSETKPPGEHIELLKYDEESSSFYPVSMGKDAGSTIAESLINYYNINRNVQTRKRDTVTKDLTEFLKTCSDTPKLVLRVRSMPEEFYFRIYLNGAYPLELYNTAQTAKPVMMWAIHEGEMVEDGPGYNKSINFISLAFPRELLTPGPNAFTIELHSIPGCKVTHTAQLRSFCLYK